MMFLRRKMHIKTLAVDAMSDVGFCPVSSLISSTFSYLLSHGRLPCGSLVALLVSLCQQLSIPLVFSRSHSDDIFLPHSTTTANLSSTQTITTPLTFSQINKIYYTLRKKIYNAKKFNKQNALINISFKENPDHLH